MGRSLNRLSPRFVQVITQPGMWCDGGGLYLQVTAGADGTPCKSWLYRFATHGRDRQMGLGALSDTSLADAREKAAHARKLVKAGTRTRSTPATLSGPPPRLRQSWRGRRALPSMNAGMPTSSPTDRAGGRPKMRPA